MTTLLHLDSSSRTDGSRSREVAATFRESWRDHHPTGQVDYRDLAAQPLPHLIEAVLAGGVAEFERTDPQVGALALQGQVIDQFLAADEYLISLPMYNFGIPSQLKAYLDHLLLVGRVLKVDGSPSPVASRLATVIVSFGGGYGPGTPREGFDFVRPYLTKVLADTLGLELTFVDVELTLAATVPAMAGLIETAETSLQQAHRRADILARATAAPLAA